MRAVSGWSSYVSTQQVRTTNLRLYKVLYILDGVESPALRVITHDFAGFPAGPSLSRLGHDLQKQFGRPA